MDAMGSAVIVSVAVPVTEPFVAEMIADPVAAVALTVMAPVAEMVTSEFELDHVTGRPRLTPPALSVVAVACAVPPAATVVGASATVIDATGSADIVSVAVPVIEPLVAVIMADPFAAVPLTVMAPVAETVTSEFELDHVTGRPRLTPPAERVVAVACAVPPAATVVGESATVIDATGSAVIVSVAVPVMAPFVAVIVLVPALAFAATVIAPVEEIVTLGLELDHVTGRPRLTPPALSVVAVACAVPPAMTLVGATATVIDATASAETVSVAVPVMVPLVAVITADPFAAVPLTVMAPAAEMVTSEFELVQVTGRPRSTPPADSVAAVACAVPPAATVAGARDTVIDATGSAVIVSVAVPVTVPFVAVMVADLEAAVALTVIAPVAEMVTSEVELDHVTGRPRLTPPALSVVAVACAVPPATTVVGETATVIDATASAEIVSVAVPVTVPFVAVMVADPVAAVALTVIAPLAEMVTSELELDHVTGRPRLTPPAESVAAVACEVPPAATVAGTRDTAMDATGAAVIVNVAVPLIPSLVAVMVLVPAVASPATVITPVAEIVALGLELAQVTGRPRLTPLAESVVADAWDVPPPTTVVGASTTLTDATGTAVMVSVALPVMPSLVAVIVLVPTEALALTAMAPVAEMVTLGLELAHVTGRPRRITPVAENVVAVAWVEPPITTDVAASETPTVATGATLTVTVAKPVRPSLVAIMSALPTATAVTTPVLDTVAIAPFDDDHTIVRPVS